MRVDSRRYQWLIACMWLGRGSSLNRLHVRGWVFLTIFQCCQKIIDMFHPIQRMFNCFKGFDGKASQVWLVITPCSKFVHVLTENSVVNISPLNEQPVISDFPPQFFDDLVCWRGSQLILDFYFLHATYDNYDDIYPWDHITAISLYIFGCVRPSCEMWQTKEQDCFMEI